jgi:23S rRNA-/tRNA-specific pseudouridylate synthase
MSPQTAPPIPHHLSTGMFPPGPVTVDAAVEWDLSTNLAAVAPSTTVPGSKDAAATFRLLATDAVSGTALVQCEPGMGRTHQIRIHLSHLGHPIANDDACGATLGRPRAKRILRRKGDEGGAALAKAAAEVSAVAKRRSGCD